MKERLLDFLVCPIDKTKLQLIIWEEKENNLTDADLSKIKRFNDNIEIYRREIITGALLNTRRKIYYPIINGIPRMLTYKSGIFNNFIKKYKTKIQNELSDFAPPNFQIPEGEKSVIKSFSNEWLNYEWNEETYWKVNSEKIYKSMRYMLDLDRKPIKDKLVLEVGIGIGGIGNYFSSKEGCELFGIDLSYAVDSAFSNFNLNPCFHIIQASAFALPFKSEVFDYVYSQGVLHHSSDPKKCFDNVATSVKKDGYFYVWLYSTMSEKRDLLRRIIMTMEEVLRPLIWPLPNFIQNIILIPIALLYLLHQNIIKSKNSNLSKYSWREAIHAARDRFTPRYAFRYSEKEIIHWYKNASFCEIQGCKKTNNPDYLIEDFYLATAIIGKKA